MMNRTFRYASSLFLAAAIAAPVSIVAAPARQDAAVQDRVYDADHKDYHNWDDHENQMWHQYLTENHKKERDFQKAEKKEQADYWKWRHDHPDSDDRH
jgi:hypothetical protein